ncbi:monocarboxylate uptake permease MctP [Granulibacter bethesdensis]|uniref:Sodium/pantothenate symporter n=1 Tax=Granulibacter bethesdensis (strain ATCC BAA-1260 / CGDNIH1) TaxID=391165 RepID=Q0BQF3_GRABC|nr:sodium:solute symporter [Granulibacter bethesdensis]ABI62949.1 Sodium/pantothenate symporter [Granulibacter bethesdensis CGDNIH1]AHJ68091.1 Sodium/pantothenate symporter [Granulibacter bethesdensis]APH52818.1 Sodium/pantothenate symporter [Granulibacter bethesdensis]APH65506.1 Sodium/pantothenate symporter [Granulibacter bethesdensis]
MDWVATGIFIGLFIFVTLLGFAAARWRAGDLNQLHEWSLGGRRFGTFVTWFLLGGDLYTAYTFIAVPAFMYGKGAMGFFAIPYTILIYPILYLVFPRLWTVAHRQGYTTAADFVRGRFGNRWLSLAVAITGLLATMPYIALQLVGMEVVIGALGFHGTGLWGDMPLIIAFLILAAFTYTSGLRAPAMIAVVKDLLIYITVFAAAIIVPMHLGGFGQIFAHIPSQKLLLATPGPDSLGDWSVYATLALGSAIALFLYPHSLTGVLSASSPDAIRRNAAILPAYSFTLALLALLGFMAIAVGLTVSPQLSVPELFKASFPSWFVGVAFAAIAIGALVPAAIMSIATAAIFTRNVWREFLRPNCTDAEEAGIAKFVSMLVKLGALVFIIFMPKDYAIQLQLLGGVWIIQTAPPIFLGLYSRFFRSWPLLAGWAVGIVSGTWMVAETGFKGATYGLHLGSWTIPGYAAVYALILNIAASTLFSAIFALKGPEHTQDLSVLEEETA